MEVVQNHRKLINFIEALSSFDSVEGIFEFINNHLVKVKSVNNLILCTSPSKLKKLIYYKDKNKVFTQLTENSWLQESTIRVDNIDDSQFLANHLRRPVGQIIAFPIKMNKLESLSKMEVPATIFIEHSGQKSEQDKLIKELINYIQPIQFALEKSFIQLHLNNAAIEWQTTFDGLKDPICIVDLEYNILRANKAFAQNLNDKQKCYQVLGNSNEKCLNCPNTTVFKNKKFSMSELRMGNKVFNVHSYPITSKVDGTVTTFVNHYIDITQSQQLKGNMLQGEKLAVIGQLAGNISHELNNPLTGIKSLADILISENDCSEQMLTDLSEVSNAATRCQNIINNLMMFSNENSQPQKKVVALNEQVKVAMTLSKSIQGNRQLFHDFSIKSTNISVIPELMVQVLFNLIQNACQATSNDGIIELSTSVVGEFVYLSIKDDGCGIKSNILEDIFKPFYTTKSIGEGTGLGLSMSRDIIKSFDGEIRVESKEGLGAKFIIKLPLAHSVGS